MIETGQLGSARPSEEQGPGWGNPFDGIGRPDAFGGNKRESGS